MEAQQYAYLLYQLSWHGLPVAEPDAGSQLDLLKGRPP